jgi:hypothetical protein
VDDHCLRGFTAIAITKLRKVWPNTHHATAATSGTFQGRTAPSAQGAARWVVRRAAVLDLCS